jgi:hypothetical protein
VRAGERSVEVDGDGSLLEAVTESLRALTPKPEDAALHALAREYAEAIDSAIEIADAAALIELEDEDQAKRLAALLRRVERQAVLADLGPKLQAALDALGASPKSRAAMQSKGGGAGDGKSGNRLDELRERRARQRDAAPLDPATS